MTDVSTAQGAHLPSDNEVSADKTTNPRRTDTDDLENIPESKPEADQPPNGGYGWVCVACNAMINSCTWGVNSTYAVFLAYYLNNDYFPGTSALAYAFIGGLSISMAMLVAPLATKCTATFGTKVTLHIGVFLETLSFIGASFARVKYQIILAQGICFGFGMGFLFVGSVGIIPQWFTTKRSIANAISAAGSGFGGLVWSLSAQAMIDNLGLPWTFRIIGIVCCVVNLTCSNIVKDRNKQVGARNRSFDWELLRRPEVIILQLFSWFSMLGYVTVLFSLPSYARQIGLTAHEGAIVGAIFNLGQMLGRPFIGLASDRWGRINLAGLLTFTCGIFCFIFWIPSEVAPEQLGLLLFFCIVGGALAGTFWAVIPAVAAEVVGLPDLGSALSWTWLIMVPPVTCAEPIALLIRRSGASEFVYIYAQLFCGLSYVGGGLAMWVVRGWKIGEMEEMERLKQITDQRRSRRSMMETSQEKSDIGPMTAPQDVLTREVSIVSARKQGWKPRDLFRRMMKPKIV